jgi:5,6,7,8-tetrahydromethanopterin hydro-lyase
MFGPAQYAVAKAVADSVAEGVIPANEADDLYVTVGVFIHWEAKDDKKIQDFNYRATKEALARAVKGEPKASEVTAKKDSAHHPFAASWSGETGKPPGGFGGGCKSWVSDLIEIAA